jgi:hypothetical protein
METIIVLFLALIAFLYWEYNFGRAAKLFKSIKSEEPETYNSLCNKSVFYPSLIIKGIIAQNQYTQIKSDKLKQELLNIDNTEAKHSAYLVLAIVVYFSINLLF